MTDTTSSEQLVREFFAVLSTGDLEKLRTYIDADTTWEPKVSKDLPGSGIHTGNDIVDKFIGPVRGLFAPGDPKVHVDTIVSGGDMVMCETRGVGKLLSGGDYNNVYAWAFIIRGGRIKAIREYMDSAYVVKLFGL
ncbi:hypothetical protein GJV26_02575 [Massilia dura]|uniref:SnoaL-like domain-containing protein n=1 Tax=Pseudoduganella dura TaxID=321982 RepID=A0A6I3XF82_9BURK|nr:nuclear transport factor 2 family protein [Pseudoduganella dura]MUI11378.1 hypothetical protein [Pseudoduganella dura]GGX95777.1 hypothetical protein GCM10007386_28370 [Pseudoduganella dura]